MGRAMTRTELAAAQFALSAYDSAERLADALEPQRRRATSVVRNLDAISSRARDALWDLTGLLPNEVNMTDLNTESPAPWTNALGRGKAGG